MEHGVDGQGRCHHHASQAAGASFGNLASREQQQANCGDSQGRETFSPRDDTTGSANRRSHRSTGQSPKQQLPGDGGGGDPDSHQQGEVIQAQERMEQPPHHTNSPHTNSHPAVGLGRGARDNDGQSH